MATVCPLTTGLTGSAMAPSETVLVTPPSVTDSTGATELSIVSPSPSRLCSCRWSMAAKSDTWKLMVYRSVSPGRVPGRPVVTSAAVSCTASDLATKVGAPTGAEPATVTGAPKSSAPARGFQVPLEYPAAGPPMVTGAPVIGSRMGAPEPRSAGTKIGTSIVVGAPPDARLGNLVLTVPPSRVAPGVKLAVPAAPLTAMAPPV